MNLKFEIRDVGSFIVHLAFRITARINRPILHPFLFILHPYA
jgi:hypothetical protein